jgi:hypothetical protein
MVALASWSIIITSCSAAVLLLFDERQGMTKLIAHAAIFRTLAWCEERHDATHNTKRQHSQLPPDFLVLCAAVWYQRVGEELNGQMKQVGALNRHL